MSATFLHFDVGQAINIGSLLATIVLGTILLALIIFLIYPASFLMLHQRWSIWRGGFKSKKITTPDGYKFSYIERGRRSPEKSTILLLHGFSSSKDNFCIMAKFLPVKYHLICLDLPGHGGTSRRLSDNFAVDSQVKRIKEFVDAMELAEEKFHLLGLSMGGNVAGVYATKHGDDIESVVLLCPAGLETDKESDLFKTYLEKGKMLLIPSNLEEMKTMYEYVVHRTVKIPDIFMKAAVQMRVPSNYFYEKVLRDVAKEETRYLLQKSMHTLTRPTLVIWGKQDRTLPVSGAQILKEGLPNAEVHELDDCGHCINLERPRKAAKLITTFIDKQTA